jgi:hypothetical protein
MRCSDGITEKDGFGWDGVTVQLLVKYIADGLKSKGWGLIYLASCNREKFDGVHGNEAVLVCV